MKKEKIINLTPHDVNVVDENFKFKIIKTYPKADMPLPRIKEKKFPLGQIDGVNVFGKVLEDFENIPIRKNGVYYIVSGLIVNALNRDDLLVPDVVRDKTGCIMGCNGFSKII